MKKQLSEMTDQELVALKAVEPENIDLIDEILESRLEEAKERIESIEFDDEEWDDEDDWGYYEEDDEWEMEDYEEDEEEYWDEYEDEDY